jgi:hypothetical protein
LLTLFHEGLVDELGDWETGVLSGVRGPFSWPGLWNCNSICDIPFWVGGLVSGSLGKTRDGVLVVKSTPGHILEFLK